MFYFLMEPILMYNWLLITAAVIPAIVLMIKVYRADRIERESSGMLRTLVVAGVLSTLLAEIEERVGEYILLGFVEYDSMLYNVILYFGIVGVAEESSKYILLKKNSWNSHEFNCQYDGVVYAVFVSLGFALWENVHYVLNYGFSTALVRAVTAVPGHACFGVFMGIFYGLARKMQNYGHPLQSKIYRILAVLMPTLLHGSYDYIASMETMQESWFFIVFVAALFAISFGLVNRTSNMDEYIS